MKDQKLYLSLIVPFYNEDSKIVNTYRELNEFFKHQNYKHEIIFVDDGSSDNSYAKLLKIAKGNKQVIVLTYKKNKGRGGAIKVGVSKASGKIVGYIDSDLEISPKYIDVCLKNIQNYDCVIGSKRMKGARVQTTFLRKLSSYIFNFWIKLVLGSKIEDHQTGLKFFSRNILKREIRKIKSDGWLFDVELLYYLQQNDARILEIPIDVKYGFEKIKESFIVDFIKMFYYVLLIKKHGKK